MEDKKPIGKDLNGYDFLTKAVKELLNQFPGLYEGEVIKFEELEKEDGIAFSADNGALIYSQKIDVIGFVHQMCRFPFYVIYRTAGTSERQKLSVQEFLDLLGKWICKEPIEIDGMQYKIQSYPKLSAIREIKNITRDNSYGLEPQESGTQDWILPLSVEYTNKFKR